MNPSSSSTSIVPYNVDQDLIQFLPPTSHRHQQTYSERAEVKTLSPFLPARDIAARTHIALSTVKKDIKSDLPADTRAHSSRGGSKPKLSVEQESQLRAWILRLRAWEAEVTRTIVRIQALRLFSHVPFFRASCVVPKFSQEESFTRARSHSFSFLCHRPVLCVFVVTRFR